MRHAAEDVLRQRVCRWQQCNAIFWICRRCDHGQRYCSEHCRIKARRAQRRAANLRHRKTLEGKLDQRDRQRAYRRRRAALSVMDQGSLVPSDTGSIIPPVFRLPVFAANSGKHHEPGVSYCFVCGRPGRFVNPFQLRR
jgi:hypothetical protein